MSFIHKLHEGSALINNKDNRVLKLTPVLQLGKCFPHCSVRLS